MSQQPSDVEKRFWDKVDKQGGDGECWEWQGATTSRGYGDFKFDGGVEQAHRVALLIDSDKFNSLEEIDVVRHRCDNKTCVRASHLTSGDLQDNSRDAVKRERISGQKISAEQAVEIRERYENEDVYQRELAEEYGVTRENITHIVNGDSFKFV